MADDVREEEQQEQGEEGMGSSSPISRETAGTAAKGAAVGAAAGAAVGAAAAIAREKSGSGGEDAEQTEEPEDE